MAGVAVVQRTPMGGVVCQMVSPVRASTAITRPWSVSTTRRSRVAPFATTSLTNSGAPSDCSGIATCQFGRRRFASSGSMSDEASSVNCRESGCSAGGAAETRTKNARAASAERPNAYIHTPPGSISQDLRSELRVRRGLGRLVCRNVTVPRIGERRAGCAPPLAALGRVVDEREARAAVSAGRGDLGQVGLFERGHDGRTGQRLPLGDNPTQAYARRETHAPGDPGV